MFLFYYIYSKENHIIFPAIFYCTVTHFEKTELPSYTEHLHKLAFILCLYIECFSAQKCSKVWLNSQTNLN